MKDDPLAKYGEYMTIKDIAECFDIGYSTARDHVLEMPSVSVGFGQKNKSRRVTKADVRKRFNIPTPFRSLNGGSKGSMNG